MTLPHLRLLAFSLLLLALSLVACNPAATPSLSPAPIPSPIFTSPPTATFTPSPTHTPYPATPSPSPAPSDTATLGTPSTTPRPTPSATRTLVPTPAGQGVLRYAPHDLALALSWSLDGSLLAAAVGENVHLVEAHTLAELRLLPVGAWAVSLAFSPDSKRLALAVKDGSVQVWDPAAGQLVCRLVAHHPGAKSVAFSPDGRWLASTGNDAYVRVWNISAIPAGGVCELTPLVEMIGGVFSVPAAAFSPDGTVVASVDGAMILLREVSTQRLVRTIHAPASIFTLAYHPAGSRLGSGELGNVIHVWDAASGEMLLEMNWPGRSNDFISAVAFSPDGKWLAAGSSDSTVMLWEAATGELLRTFTGHRRAVTGVAFSPDGLRLASSSLDATVRIFLWEQP